MQPGSVGHILLETVPSFASPPVEQHNLAITVTVLAPPPTPTSTPAATPTVIPSGVTYTGTVVQSTVSTLHVGQVYALIHVLNQNYETLGQLAGQATFSTNDPRYTCLDGEDSNIWSYQGQYYLHNGDMGPQCVYGSWRFPVSP